MAGDARDTQLDITSNFCGDHAGQYIASCLKQAKSLDYLTLLENIKYKRSISVMTGGHGGGEGVENLVGDRTCAYTPAGVLNLDDKTLSPKELQVNYTVCKSDIVKDWQALQMKSGQWNTAMGADFSAFLISHIAGIIASSTESSIWTGAEATAGEFEGFMTATTGAFAVGGTTDGGSPTGGAYTVDDIITDLSALLAAVPSCVYSNTDDLYMYMGTKAYRMYISAVSALGYVNAYSMNADYVPYFEGVKIAVCPGMPDDNAVVANRGSLFAGTDLISDETEVKVLDMSTLDGSDEIRIVAKYTMGVQTGYGPDITWQK